MDVGGFCIGPGVSVVFGEGLVLHSFVGAGDHPQASVGEKGYAGFLMACAAVWDSGEYGGAGAPGSAFIVGQEAEGSSREDAFFVFPFVEGCGYDEASVGKLYDPVIVDDVVFGWIGADDGVVPGFSFVV